MHQPQSDPASEAASADARPADERATMREEVIPSIEERLEVGKEIEETDRVRVATHASTREVDVDATAYVEHLEIERVPIDRYVERPPEARVEGDTVVIPVLEEVVVVQKRLLLKEEVRVHKRRVEEPRRLRVPARTQEVTVEHIGPRSR